MRYLVFILTAAFLGTAFARLPPPTPEEKAKLEKQAAEKAAQTEKQAQELARAQERVARAYRERHPGKPDALPQVSEQLGKSDVPKSAKQPLGSPAHPYAGRQAQPQGQAHSAGSTRE